MQDGSALIDIGAYLIEGEVITLKRPFLVTEKISQMAASDTISETTNALKINGVVRKKIIFKTRPKPKSIELIESEKASGRW